MGDGLQKHEVIVTSLRCCCGHSGGAPGVLIAGEIMAQNDQKFCHSLSISGTVPHMIVVFGMCKMMISTGIFFHLFQNFDFWGVFRGGGKRTKDDP